MKKLTALLFVLAFSVTALGACGGPCEKAYKKLEKCTLKELPKKNHAEFKKALKANKDKFMKECKKQKSKVEDCVKIDDCKKFDKCMDKIK